MINIQITQASINGTFSGYIEETKNLIFGSFDYVSGDNGDMPEVTKIYGIKFKSPSDDDFHNLYDGLVDIESLKEQILDYSGLSAEINEYAKLNKEDVDRIKQIDLNSFK